MPDFVDINPELSIDSYLSLSTEEKIRLAKENSDKNKVAAQQTLDEIGADWVLILGGEIVSYGGRREEPDETRLLEIAREYGKPPFVMSRPIHISPYIVR